MKKLLTVFIDGLKPDSLRFMPFLNSFRHKARLETLLGYSVTCHASMYSGVYPEKHKIWFSWKYQPETSPFRWLPDNKLMDWINVLPIRYVIGKASRLFYKNTSYSGLPVMQRSSLRNWRYFDLVERKLWNEPDYIENYPTIFDIMNKENLPFQCVGLVNAKMHGGALTHIKSYRVPPIIPNWTYLFIGEVDHVSHVFGQESEQARRILSKIDKELERVFDQFKRKLGHEPYFVCWSDHGHMMVKQHIDIYDHFSKRGKDLDKFIHIIDTNFARFWFRNDDEREVVTQVLNDMPSGFILEQQHFLKYHTEMPDRRYGDMIYYLDFPYMFQKTVWGYGRHTKSIHGYLPDYPEKDGLLISNIPIAKEGHVELVDIAPSLLDILEIPKEVAFDGSSVWT